jgi:uncharacterized protein YlxP (DUF503 family)
MGVLGRRAGSPPNFSEPSGFASGERMIVGVCKFRIHLSEIQSLKEKRSFLQRVKDKVFARFKIALSEVGDLDLRQSTVLGFALTGNDENQIRSIIHKFLSFIEEREGARIEEEQIEVFPF